MSAWFQHYAFAPVYDRLLVGAYPLDAGDVQILQRQHVSRVLNLVQDEEYRPGQRPVVARALEAAGIAEQRMDLVDFGHLPAERLETAVAMVVEWLDEPGVSYVHCRAGWQRSAAVAAGAVAIREGVGIDEAMDYVRVRKTSADPLPHQREDLRVWWAARQSAADGA